tara:strand:+ start:4147 stop:4482 length:336 start_codon:yes stop_codon:yes gene_type:complete
MSHQDWTPFVMQKRTTQKKEQKTSQKKVSQLAENIETKFIPASDFKVKMMQARVAKKMTQKDLAAKMNVPITQIQKWESGKIVPTNQQIAKVSRAIGVELPRCKKIKQQKD